MNDLGTASLGSSLEFCEAAPVPWGQDGNFPGSFFIERSASTSLLPLLLAGPAQGWGNVQVAKPGSHDTCEEHEVSSCGRVCGLSCTVSRLCPSLQSSRPSWPPCSLPLCFSTDWHFDFCGGSDWWPSASAMEFGPSLCWSFCCCCF